ncbi:MAG: asparagine synthase (glutamine-hydrolyzing), partial [Desulfomonilaceae bacterium]
MCGIVCGVHNPPLHAELIQASLDVMRHRGPDDSGYHTDGPVFLGNRRLAIIDIAGGRQPVFNEDRSVAVVLNGEIYNYVELMNDLVGRGHVFATRSDTETLVHLWEEYGTEMCVHLRGMFAFALWDAKQQVLYTGRDRLGKKPLYYTRTADGGILGASELKALRILAEGSEAAWSVDDQGVYDYLSLGVTPQPYTIFKGVYALEPASYILVRLAGMKIERKKYWRLSYDNQIKTPYPSLLEQVRGHIEEAVRLRLRSDVPLGVFLSGGLDSSIVAYEAAKKVGDRLLTFSIAFKDTLFDETPISTITASRLQIRNLALPLEIEPAEDLQRIVSLFDQPFADSSALPTYRVSKLASEFVKVVLTGDGGDELFGGYRRHLAAHLLRLVDWIPQRIPRALSGLIELSETRRSAVGLAARFMRGMSLSGPERYLCLTTDMFTEHDKRRCWIGAPMRPTEQWLSSIMSPSMNGMRGQMYADIKVNLLSDLLVKMDMASMAASVEARSPLLDHVLAEFMAKVSPGQL